MFRQEATFSIPFHCLVMATLHSNGQTMPLFYSGELFIYYNWATVCNGRGCPLVVRYWADLQPVNGFRCYDNSAEREMSSSACTRSRAGYGRPM